MLKVRQIQNDFFKSTFLPKNERINLTLLHSCWLVRSFFGKKWRHQKRHFEINWPLYPNIFEAHFDEIHNINLFLCRNFKIPTLFVFPDCQFQVIGTQVLVHNPSLLVSEKWCKIRAHCEVNYTRTIITNYVNYGICWDKPYIHNLNMWCLMLMIYPDMF